MNIRDLFLRARALFRPNRVERDLHDELSFHIEREAMKLMEHGLSPDDARAKAQARFGSTTVAADECRDERGTAFVDNTIGDIQYALRTFARAPLAAATIVITVSIGLGVIAVLYTFLNIFLFRIDTVPDVSEIYAIERPDPDNNGRTMFTRTYFDALRADTHVFSDAYVAVNDLDLRVDGRMMGVNLVSESFFRVIATNPAMGRGFQAADDSPAGGNPVVVLSDRGWERHFQRALDVVGRTVLVNGAPYEIVGVMPRDFRGLEPSAPDLWAPVSRAADFMPNLKVGAEPNVQIIGRLRPGLSRESARAQLAAWESNQAATTTIDRTLPIELHPHDGTIPDKGEAIAVFTPLFFLFGLILMIGSANVANLLLARGVARQKEIGIRLSLGASRKRIIRQLLTESVLLSLAAAAGGYLISRVALEGTVYFTMRSIPLDIGNVNLAVPAADWRVAVFLVAAAMVATAFFALMPALQATRVEPVRTLRGELVKDARPGRARNVLIGIQVFASTLLLICAAIFLRSAIASSRFNPGMRTADTVLIETASEPKRAALVQQMTVDPAIAGIAALNPFLLAPPPRAFADAGTGAGKLSVGYKYVSANYFDVLGVPIVRGRTFTAEERDQHPSAIVSESLARTLWPNSDGVGQTLRLDPDATILTDNKGLQVNPDALKVQRPLTSRVVTVVGISRDVPGFRFTTVKDAEIFIPTGIEVEGTMFLARVNGDPDLARQGLLERLTRVDPNMGQIITMRTVARLETFFLQTAFWVSLVLGALALLLTVSGLFSVLSYLVEQRTREIGVRIALGATSPRVTRMMLAQTTWPVLLGLAAGTSLAAALAAVLLASEAGAMISAIVRVADPVAYLVSLAVIVTACLVAAWIPASRASRLDPMKTLRQE